MAKSILIIEDDPMLLKSIVLILKRQGCVTYEARNGKEAIQALEERDYDLVLTDIMLPYANGLELLGRIREDKKHSGTPVMILSAVHNEDTLLEGFSIGADDYLKKPFVPGELISRINRLLMAQKRAS